MYHYPQYRSGVSLAFFIIFLIALWFGGAALLGGAGIVDDNRRGEFTAFGVIAALIVALLWTAVVWLIYPHSLFRIGTVWAELLLVPEYNAVSADVLTTTFTGKANSHFPLASFTYKTTHFNTSFAQLSLCKFYITL